MYLKALTLKGFKSFADKTDLNFEQGVTVVVGPNGSGKSNLVDAVAWVLGAQGARALRGAKMDDVIFAGTTKKSALGRAEVSLTIDNSDGTLPIEFTEVTITRTLFRSGESEYRLNDVPCRLLDIQELLSDSRIGRTQHVIVGQGQLDSVLNARPEDRRAIIEEAAGVLKYRKRREKAQRRLEATEGNLTRLGDLVREVRRGLTPLQRQADAARRHDGVRDELNAIRLFLTGQELRGLQATLKRVSEQRLGFQEKEKLLLSELTELDISVLDAEASLMKVGDSDVAQWLSRAERLVARTGATLAMLAERKRSITTQLDASADESVIESLLSEKESLNASIAELIEQNSSIEPRLVSLRAQYEGVNQEYKDLIATAPSEDIVRDYENAAREKRLHANNLEVLRDRFTADTQRLEGVRHRISILSQDNKDANEVAATESASLTALQDKHAILMSNLEGLRNNIETVEKQYKDAQDSAAQKKAKHAVLVEAFEVHENNSGIEKVRAQSGVLGTLLENISIDEVAINACSTILEDLASAIVVDSPESAKYAIAELSSQDVSARLLVLGSVQGYFTSNLPAGASPLADYITSDNQRISQSLEQLLSGIVFVDGDWQAAFEMALAHPQLIVVTPSGDRFGGSRTWSVGRSSVRTVTKESLETALRASENATRALDDYSQQLATLTAQRNDSEILERECATEMSETFSRNEIARRTVSVTESGMGARELEATSLESEIAELETHIATEDATVTELTSRVETLGQQKDNAISHQESFRTQKRETESARSALSSEIRSLEMESELLHARLDDCRERMVSVEERLAKDPEQQQVALARRQALVDMMSDIDSLFSRTKAVEDGATRARDLLSDERRKQTERAHESTSRLESLRVSRRDAEKLLLETRDSLQKGDITEAETRTRLTTTVETLRNNHDCEPDVAINAEMPEVAEGTTLTSRARDLDRELKLMGPINPLAVQEYDELNERHVFLNQQLDDVKASRKELHKVIKTIDEEIVTVFEKAFEDVQKHFSDLFTTLFSGGAGRLTLTDPNDMLNTGIDMEARPSGKNVRRLSLLSGGERSLTALAFLFAVFRSRPSPFYIMDEVEAALDEPNLMRFLDLVAEFRHDAQLLIVSHQKKTMEAADELYGVSMAPGGTSRAIRQRVENPASSAGLEKTNVVDLVAAEEQELLDEQSGDAESILESSI